MANKLQLKGNLLSHEKMFCMDTKSPFYTLRRRKHVLWKGWVRLVTFFTAFSILVHNQYIRIEQYSTILHFVLSCWSIIRWTSGACGGRRRGVRAHPSHPPFLRAWKFVVTHHTFFPKQQLFKNVEERFLRVKISARDIELIFVFLF